MQQLPDHERQFGLSPPRPPWPHNPWPATHTHQLEEFPALDTRAHTSISNLSPPIVGSSHPSHRDLPIPSIDNVDRQLFLPTQNVPGRIESHNELPPQASASNSGSVGGKNRRWRPDDAQWQAHKRTIEELYMDKDWTLERTMEYMEKNMNFKASKKMYNGFFKIWGFRKHVPRKAAKIVSKRGKSSIVRVGNTLLSEARVERAVQRLERMGLVVLMGWFAIDGPTPPGPPDVLVATPGAVPQSPAPRIAEGTVANPVDSGWTPSYPSPHPAISRANWNSMSLEELRALKAEAAIAFVEGRTREAECQFRDAIAGFRHLTGQISHITMMSAYQLFSFFCQTGRAEDANTVLNWMTSTLIAEVGLEKPKSINHLMNVVELLHKFSKDSHAAGIIRGMFKPLKSMMADYASSSRVQDLDEDNRSEEEHNLINDSEAEVKLNSDLGITRCIQLASVDPTRERLLSRFIQLCGKHPSELGGLEMRSRVLLVEHHEKRQEMDQAFLYARDAVRRLTELMPEPSDEPHFDLLESSRDLAHMYLRNDRAPLCEKVLIWVADRLESNTTSFPREYGLNNLAAIDYMVQAGMSYMVWNEDDWPSISSWLQRAYRLTISLTGPQSSLSAELGKALATRGKSMFGLKFEVKGIAIGSKDFTLTTPPGICIPRYRRPGFLTLDERAGEDE
ncbi:hypothetical protein V8F20_006490 [Naviculisporaceae sp. PSN 640]